VAGLATALGSGAMTNSIAEISGAKTILAIGTNTTQAHPVLALHNPKKIDLCRHATIHLQHRPGTDVALLMGMIKVIVDEGLADLDYIATRCENFEQFLASLAEFNLDAVAAITGVDQELIAAAARLYGSEQPAATLYCMGITQHSHGTDNVWAIANLGLITGNVGIPHGGVNPLRGQNNVQGSCDMGGLPDVYPGYQKVDNPDAQQKFEAAWGVKLSETPGLTHSEIFDKIHEGTIKSLYLVGENPYLSEANASHAIEAMEKIDFLVVQDIFLTETAQLADVVLPAATFAEKDGTFTNTERRIQRVRAAIAPRGEAKEDWRIVTEIARRMGAPGFDYNTPAEIMAEIAALTPSYGGITYERLEEGGLQWPCPTIDHPGTPILHTERFSTASGKARLDAAELSGIGGTARQRVPPAAHHRPQPLSLSHRQHDPPGGRLGTTGKRGVRQDQPGRCGPFGPCRRRDGTGKFAAWYHYGQDQAYRGLPAGPGVDDLSFRRKPHQHAHQRGP